MSSSHFLLNVSNNHSFDNVFQSTPIYNCKIITCSTALIPKLYRVLATATARALSQSEIESDVRDIYNSIITCEYINTKVNFECCSAYMGKTFSDEDGINHSSDVISFIHFMRSRGAQIICSDFSAKALIKNWDPTIFKYECPIVEEHFTVDGKINVKFSINHCRNSIFSQMKTLANLAIPDLDTDANIASVTMKAMEYTIVVSVKPDVPGLHTDVLSVATNIRPSHDNTAVASETNIQGYPIHIIITFDDEPGSIVVSCLHLSNLSVVNTTDEKILKCAQAQVTPEEFNIMKTVLSTTTDNQARCNYVSHLSSTSTQ